jgi:hypothetical protein
MRKSGGNGEGPKVENPVLISGSVKCTDKG